MISDRPQARWPVVVLAAAAGVGLVMLGSAFLHPSASLNPLSPRSSQSDPKRAAIVCPAREPSGPAGADDVHFVTIDTSGIPHCIALTDDLPADATPGADLTDPASPTAPPSNPSPAPAPT